MSYTKIYYDDIWEATSKGSSKCNDWLSKLDSLSQSFASFVESDSFKGQAASNMKSYLEQVHGMLISVIGSVVQSYSVHAVDYYGGYTRIVDTGDDTKYGLRYTTIVSSEVNENGTIQSKLNDLIRTTEQVVTDANSVKNSISDLVTIYASPRTYNLLEQINAAKSKAQTVHNNATSYEALHEHDLDEIERLISQALSVINSQLGKTRVSVIAYQEGSIGDMCDINQVMLDLDATSDSVKAITENGYFDEDASLVLNRDELIKEEEEASREWIQWVAVGVAVVGAIALTVVTVGGAAPLVCAGVGAAVGAVTVASSQFADNYVETGSFVDGMDWSEFGEHVLAGAVGGFVGGYLGAVSQGAAIKQPIEKAVLAMSTTVAEKSSEAVVSTVWEAGETIYEVGDAIVAGKPGNEVLSVLNAGLEETEKDLSDGLKEAAVEGVKEFVGGGISGKFDIDTSNKSVLRKIGEKTIENVGKEAAGGTVSTLWDMGEAIVDNDSSTTVESALKKGIRDTTSNIASAATKSVVSEGIFGKVDNIDNKTGKVVMNTIKDTAEDTSGRISKGVTGRTIDYVLGDEKDGSKILGDIWEEDLDKGRSIAESAGKSLEKNILNEVHKDDKFYNDLKKIDTDGDGKIEVVQFDDYAVSKQDYDAAVRNAGKGAYKDKTVQDLLGLPKDTDISSGRERTVSIDMTEEYSSDRKTTDTVTVGGKYTFSQSYYESSINAAGSKEYGGKTAQEILGIPNDVDLSEENITRTRVDNDKIGQGKEVEFHNDYHTDATKIHISSMSRETRLEKEKQAKKNNKEN